MVTPNLHILCVHDEGILVQQMVRALTMQRSPKQLELRDHKITGELQAQMEMEMLIMHHIHEII